MAPALVRDASGLWIASGGGPVSYPEEGSDLCFALEDRSFWFRHRAAAIVAVARRFPPAAGAIFDVGAGNGQVSAALSGAGFETVAIEPSRQGAMNARKRGLDHVVCGSLEAAGFAPRSAGGVGLFDVIEHIEDDAAFLRSLHPLLLPGGRLYLTVPAYQVLWSSDDPLAGHHRRYTRGTLARLCRAAGFEVEYATYLFWFLPLPILLFRSLPDRVRPRRALSAERTSAEHQTSRLAQSLLDLALGPELAAIRRGRSVPFGGSCLLVARTAER